MEKREFIISITKDIVWEIELKGWEESMAKPYKGDASKIKDYPLGQGAISDDGKWVHMLGSVMDDECIDMAKEDELMQEVCDFQLRNSDFKFTGTFVDAFKYIKKMQEDYTRKNG